MPNLTLATIKVFCTNLDLSPSEAVDDCEARFETRFPLGYREYVTALGAGILNSYLRVFSPEKIAKELETDFRPRWREHFRWSPTTSSLSKGELSDAVVIADSMRGDELVFLAGKPDRIHILPRDSNLIEPIGGDLWESLSWFSGGGRLQLPTKVNCFQPFATHSLLGSLGGGEKTFRRARDFALRAIPNPVLEDDYCGSLREGVADYWLHLYSESLPGQLMIWLDSSEVGVRLFYSPGTASPQRGALVLALETLGFSFRTINDRTGEPV